jgi:small subunit ribosomal protein S9
MDSKVTIGRRKDAIARVYLKKGSGKITVNGKDYKKYFPVVHLREAMEQPLKQLDALTSYDVTVNVAGGGVKGQAEAVRLGIARALVEVSMDNRKPLKASGLLTRDARVVERKKAGLRKARKKEQYSKR